MSDELDENIELYPAWRQTLVEFRAAGFTYGDQIPHDWFLTSFHLPTGAEQEKMLYAQVKAIRLKYVEQFSQLRIELLKTDQMDLQSVAGYGYEIVQPREQLKRAYDDGLHTIKKAFRNMFDRSDPNPMQLTAEERRENADILARMAMLRSMLRSPRALPKADDDDEE